MDFMSADKLGITPEEREGLIALEKHFRGEICTIHNADLREVANVFSHSELRDGTVNTVLGFSMSFGSGVPDPRIKDKEFDCGCVACIGGHLSLKLQGLDITKTSFPRMALVKADAYVMDLRGSAHPLTHLFYPPDTIVSEEMWDKITPPIAADAILSFLTTGDPGWETLAEEHSFNPGELDDDEEGDSGW